MGRTAPPLFAIRSRRKKVFRPRLKQAGIANDIPAGFVTGKRLWPAAKRIPRIRELDCLGIVHGLPTRHAWKRTRPHPDRGHEPARSFDRGPKVPCRFDLVSARLTNDFRTHVGSNAPTGGRWHSTHRYFRTASQHFRGFVCFAEDVSYSTRSSANDEINSTVRGQRSNRCAEVSSSRQRKSATVSRSNPDAVIELRSPRDRAIWIA